MFKMKKILSVLSLSLLLAACHSSLEGDATKLNQHEEGVAPDYHHAQNSLDWAGVYEGLLPCADCEGIQTKLTLNDDGAYTLEEHYVKNNKQLNPSKISGQFSFDPQQRSLIRLDEHADKRTFFVGENFVEARDITTGAKLSEKLDYSLRKTN